MLCNASGHYAADASTLASWGVDLVKMDHCGHRNGTDTQLYGGPCHAWSLAGPDSLALWLCLTRDVQGLELDGQAHPLQVAFAQMSGAGATMTRSDQLWCHSLCNWGESSVWSWGASVAQMYRVQMDHLPLWSAAMGGARTVGDQSVPPHSHHSHPPGATQTTHLPVWGMGRARMTSLSGWHTCRSDALQRIFFLA